MSDQDLVVKRWRRYGKDRLYVETPEGTKIGFWDLVTNTGEAEAPEYEATLLAAVTTWRSSAGLAPSQSPAVGSLVEAAGTDVNKDRPRLQPGPSGIPATGQHGIAEVAHPQLAELWTDNSDVVAADGSAVGVPIAAQEALVVQPVRPWVDLPTNAAGAEARERAKVARDSAPVKTVLARVLGVHTSERAWRIGADGEEKVAAQLAKVASKDPRWRFLHAIPVGDRGSDIDHIVIGPGGVFTANAKHHPGAKIWVGGNTFMVNGAKQPYVRNARHEAQRAAKILTGTCGFPVHVEGLIVTVNASDVVIKAQPEGVSVTPRMQVARWLLRHGDILAPESIDAIYEAARRSTTWR